MADTKISGLAGVAAFATTQEFPVNDSGTSKKITGAQLIAALPNGTLGYAQVVANQLGISAATDLTSLTVTVTAGTGRRLRVSGQCRLRQNTTSDTYQLTIQEGATILATFVTTLGIAGQISATPSVVLTPGSGAHTYKLTLTVASGTIDLLAAATNPAYILVEDIGT